jgi:hypothetical protein
LSKFNYAVWHVLHHQLRALAKLAYMQPVTLPPVDGWGEPISTGLTPQEND